MAVLAGVFFFLVIIGLDCLPPEYVEYLLFAKYAARGYKTKSSQGYSIGSTQYDCNFSSVLLPLLL